MSPLNKSLEGRDKKSQYMISLNWSKAIGLKGAKCHATERATWQGMTVASRSGGRALVLQPQGTEFFQQLHEL